MVTVRAFQQDMSQNKVLPHRMLWKVYALVLYAEEIRLTVLIHYVHVINIVLIHPRMEILSSFTV